jgi:hypothetical protein
MVGRVGISVPKNERSLFREPLFPISQGAFLAAQPRKAETSYSGPYP